MNTQQQVIGYFVTQLLLLGYALYAAWDPFTLFFVYTIDLLIGAVVGGVLCAKQGGLKWLPWALVGTLIVSVLAFILLFAAVNILLLDESTRDTLSLALFFSIIISSVLTSWPGIILNSAITAKNIYAKRKQDIFFLPLYPLGRVVPLFPVVMIGGFIALLGFPSVIIIGMTLAHLSTDLLLLTLRSKAAKLQTIVNNHSPANTRLNIALDSNDPSNY